MTDPATSLFTRANAHALRNSASQAASVGHADHGQFVAKKGTNPQPSVLRHRPADTSAVVSRAPVTFAEFIALAVFFTLATLGALGAFT